MQDYQLHMLWSILPPTCFAVGCSCSPANFIELPGMAALSGWTYTPARASPARAHRVLRDGAASDGRQRCQTSPGRLATGVRRQRYSLRRLHDLRRLHGLRGSLGQRPPWATICHARRTHVMRPDPMACGDPMTCAELLACDDPVTCADPMAFANLPPWNAPIPWRVPKQWPVSIPRLPITKVSGGGGAKPKQRSGGNHICPLGARLTHELAS